MLDRVELPHYNLSQQQSNLGSLALDILHMIFDYCGLEHFPHLARVCKRFKGIIYSKLVPESYYYFTSECAFRLPSTTYQKLNTLFPQIKRFNNLSLQQTPLDHELVYWEEKNQIKKTRKYSTVFLISLFLLSFLAYKFKNPICNTTKLNETDLLAIALMLFLTGALTINAIYKNDKKKINDGIRLFSSIRTFGYEQKQHLALP